MKAQLTKGGLHIDERGKVAFVNGFDLSPVKRLYHISHPDASVVRAWQGHKLESKWFYCSEGSFKVVLIQLDDWENPSENLEVERYVLSADDPAVLHIPPGYVNGFTALEVNSQLMVFSDAGLSESKADDYRFPSNLWFNWKTK